MKNHIEIAPKYVFFRISAVTALDTHFFMNLGMDLGSIFYDFMEKSKKNADQKEGPKKVTQAGPSKPGNGGFGTLKQSYNPSFLRSLTAPYDHSTACLGARWRIYLHLSLSLSLYIYIYIYM
jgi:hypothetical protein